MTVDSKYEAAREDRFRRAPGVVLRRIAGEHMLVPTVTREVDLDRLFLLNATGVWVWERLDGTVSTGELGEGVAAAFGIDAATAEVDARHFLTSLIQQRLAERVDAS